MRTRCFALFVLALSFAAPAAAQGVAIKDADSATLAEVNANGGLVTVQGKDATASYIVHVAPVAYTAVESLINLEAEAARGFRITKICIGPGNATAAAWTLWQLIRTTTASSAGTVIASESTTTHSISKMDPADANWSGLARTGGTEGTSGAVIAGGTIFVPIAATGAGPSAYWCETFSDVDGKQPVVLAGVTNGVKLMFTGTAGGAGQSAQIHFVAD
jgi:hypothetical protein